MGEGHSKISGQGIINIPLGNKIVKVFAKHTPDFTENLLCISKLVREGYRAIIDEDEEFEGLTIIDKLSGNVVLRSPVENGMYPVLKPQGLLPFSMHAFLNDLAHKRHELLGHVGKERLLAASAANIGLPTI